MYEGKVVEQATATKLFGSPQHPYTQKLLAAVPRIVTLHDIQITPAGKGAGFDELTLERFAATRAGLAGQAPVFLKVAPDMDEGEPEAIVASAIAHGLDALIVGNTTVSRPPNLQSPHAGETGGLSGAPLATLAGQTLTRFARASDGAIALIAAGGIGSGAQAYERIRAGAGAVQLYSALVYGGLGLLRRIEDELALLLRRDGLTSVSQAVGQAR